MSTKLSQRIALVTETNKGIGKAVASGLARDGFLVLLGARDAVRGAAAAAELAPAGNVRFIPLDVADAESVQTAAQRIDREFGRLDVLVNNAGIGNPYRKPSEETAEALRRVYETNVFAVVTVTNAFLPLLQKSPAAWIVNVTSKRGSIGEEGAWAGQPSMAYSSSKTPLNALTVHYARELIHTSIKINGAAPGHVATDFNGFRGKRTPEEGAAVVIRLAQLGENGPSGMVFEDETPLAW